MIFFFISLSTYLCYLILKYEKGLGEFKKENFEIKKFGKWIFTNVKKTFLIPELLFVILIVVALNTNAKITGICSVVFYTLMFLYELKIKNGKFKMEAKYLRLIIIISLIYGLVFAGFYCDYGSLQNGYLLFDHSKYYYIGAFLMAYFSYFIILLAGLIDKPLQLVINKRKK